MGRWWLLGILAVGCGGGRPAPEAAARSAARPRLAAAVAITDDTTLYAEDFELGTAVGWTGLAGTWAVATDSENYVYKNTANVTVAGNGANVNDNWAVYGSPTWTDYALEARVKPLSFPGTAGIVRLFARWQNPTNWYYETLTKDGHVQLRRYRNGAILDLAPQKVYPVVVGTWYTLRLEVVGSSLRAYVNGVLQLSATDTLFKAGPIAVGGWNDFAEFDNVRVIKLGGGPPPPVAVYRVVVTPGQLQLSVGDRDSLVATDYDVIGNVLTGRAVSWASSTPAVATIGGQGQVTAVSPGDATITATSEGYRGTSLVTVLTPIPPLPSPVAYILMSPQAATIAVGQTIQFHATAYANPPPTVVNTPITWRSIDPSIATVDSTGLAFGRGAGMVTIQTSVGAILAGVTLTVTPAVPVVRTRIYALVTLQNGRAFITRSDSESFVRVTLADMSSVPDSLGHVRGASYEVRPSRASGYADGLRQIAADVMAGLAPGPFTVGNGLFTAQIQCAASTGCTAAVTTIGWTGTWTSSPPVPPAVLLGLARALESAARRDTVFAASDSLPYVRLLP